MTQTLDRPTRRARGAFYTPASLVSHLLDHALDPLIDCCLASDDPQSALRAIRVLDPACGDGAFLVAAGQRLAACLAGIRGTDDGVVRDVGSCLHGMDIDPVAIEQCAGNLGDSAHLRVADGLCDASATYDLVVGNPPFLNQVQARTAVSRKRAATLRATSKGTVKGYADMSTAFLEAATRWTAAGGRIAMVLPQSILASRDARPVRRAVAQRAAMEHLWVATEHVFDDADVFTCAVVLRIDGPRQVTLTKARRGTFEVLPAQDVDMDALAEAASWAPLAADALGVPQVAECGGRIGDAADATADFRDQYYGLRGFIVESSDLTESQRVDWEAFPPIVTSGLIDLASCHWGRKSARLLRQRWEAPRIDRRRMERDGDLGDWMTRRLVPKIIVATQTRVMEVFVDAEGRFLPSTPLISVMPREPHRIWEIAAALAAPAASALALRRHGGTALVADAIKLSASQVLNLPLPSDHEAWTAALRSAHGGDVSTLRGAAPGSADLVHWWAQRAKMYSDCQQERSIT